tara:strand:+ start:4267 stop:5016 length:750 start_codon:yes stop_codon:yes gene_type:complete
LLPGEHHITPKTGPLKPRQTEPVKLSVIIPTFNAADTLPSTLKSLSSASKRGIALEIVIVDAHSQDDTERIAERAGAKFIKSDKGRGIQLATGVKSATGDWFLFLHADTILTSGWDASFVVFTTLESNLNRAAVFTFALSACDSKARFIEKVVRLRNNWLGLPYGDQGLIIHRRFYSRLGGYKSWTIMEDIDLVRRIGMSRIALLDVKATTSATRYQQDGYMFRVIRNLTCLTLYFLRVPPNWISKIYG